MFQIFVTHHDSIEEDGGDHAKINFETKQGGNVKKRLQDLAKNIEFLFHDEYSIVALVLRHSKSPIFETKCK